MYFSTYSDAVPRLFLIRLFTYFVMHIICNNNLSKNTCTYDINTDIYSRNKLNEFINKYKPNTTKVLNTYLS